MAKGYMIFVDGGGTPQVIHTTFDAAMWQMKELAEKTGKEVFLFRLLKRCANKDGKNMPLPCHTPPDFKNPERLTLDRLVYKKESKPASPT